MTLLERLKELAKSDKRRDGEPFIVWVDRISDENCWIREEALPILLELAEAAVEVADVARLREDDVLPKPEDDPKLWTARMQTAWNELDKRIAALEVEA